jgi:gliding motility-associated protein GldL
MGISDFLGSPLGKRITGTAYGFGASLVIVGALFKIMHWPFASLMLCAGMFAEAILFALSALEKPHKTFDWALVYPELEGDVANEKQEKSLLPSVDIATLVEDEMKRLADGVKRLGETAGQLSSLSSAALASDTYVNNLTSASDAAKAFAESQTSLKDSSESLQASYQDIASSMGSVSQGSKDFADQMSGISRNASSINSVFELQAKSMAEQNELMIEQNAAMKTLAASVAQMGASINTSTQQAEEYKQQVTTLTEQMRSLNAVYGNMLSAITIRG